MLHLTTVPSTRSVLTAGLALWSVSITFPTIPNENMPLKRTWFPQLVGTSKITTCAKTTTEKPAQVIVHSNKIWVSTLIRDHVLKGLTCTDEIIVSTILDPLKSYNRTHRDSRFSLLFFRWTPNSRKSKEMLHVCAQMHTSECTPPPFFSPLKSLDRFCATTM